MFSLFRQQVDSSDLLRSKLYDQDSFYDTFISDLNRAESEIIIESPFISKSRMVGLLPVIRRASDRGIYIVVNTRHPQEHDERNSVIAQAAIEQLQDIGVAVLYTGRLHRKVAIVDRQILWEGSLNILSQSMSCEIMRRTNSIDLAKSMLRFTQLDRFLQPKKGTILGIR